MDQDLARRPFAWRVGPLEQRGRPVSEQTAIAIRVVTHRGGRLAAGQVFRIGGLRGHGQSYRCPSRFDERRTTNDEPERRTSNDELRTASVTLQRAPRPD